MIAALLRAGANTAIRSATTALSSAWTTMGGAAAGASSLETAFGVLRVASAVDTAANLPETLKSIGVGINKRSQEVSNEYISSTDDLKRKYEKLKQLYIQDTGKQPPE